MSKCTGLIGSLLGHNFKAVFDEKPIQVHSSQIVKDMMGNQKVKKVPVIAIEKKYTQSVCSRCGEVRFNSDVLREV